MTNKLTRENLDMAKKMNFNRETECILRAAQNNAIKTSPTKRE